MAMAEIETRVFLEQAASTRQLEPQQLEGLMAVCRKIDIGRRLFRSYRAGWGNPADTVPLIQASEWPDVIEALLSCAGSVSEPAVQLKLLNTVFKARDIALDADKDDVAGRLATAGQRAETMLAEALA